MELLQVYLYEGIAVLPCSVLLSFRRTSILEHVTACNVTRLYRQIDGCLNHIHALGVRHKDVWSLNVLYNAKTERVIFIDFERVEVVNPQLILGGISVNRKRKRQDDAFHKHCRSARIIEGGQVKADLQSLAKTRYARLA
jgi:hypothetical protein